jgi:DNA mismatch repair protein MutS2
MRFAPGDHVQVAALGKGIVREARNGGRYVVEIKGRPVEVAGAQLVPAEPPRASRRAKVVAPVTQTAEVAGPAGAAARSIDLHGSTVDESVELLDAFLNDALLAGVAEVRIIHGRSGGRLKSAVHARLKVLPSVRHFRLDPRNPGVTIVGL